MLSQIQNNTSIQVASFYEVTKNSIAKHFLRNTDELIENIHYFYDYEQTKRRKAKSNQMDFRRCL